MTRRIAAATLFVLAACSSSSTDQVVTPTPKFLIRGNDMSGFNNNVYVSVDGVGKPGLTMVVNGSAMTDQGSGQYFVRLGSAVAAGGTVQLNVTDGTYTASAVGVVPETPVVTSANAASHGAPVAVTWTSATSPDSFNIYVDFRLPDSSVGAATLKVGGAARQASVPQTDIPANGVVYSIGIDAFMTGTFSGAYASGSTMNLRASSPSFPLTVP